MLEFILGTALIAVIHSQMSPGVRFVTKLVVGFFAVILSILLWQIGAFTMLGEMIWMIGSAIFELIYLLITSIF